MTDFQDLLNYAILRDKMSQFQEELRLNKDNPKSLKAIIKDFISFSRSILREIRDTKFSQLISKQVKLARELLAVINLRWVIIFLYRRVMTTLLNSLVSLINVVVNQIKL